MRLKPAAISPAPAVFRDGALYSPHFGDIYHSVEGAIAESRHVFLEGNDLGRRWKDNASFTIVETGFGCGLNFLLTWNALRESGADCRLDFVSVEKHPFRHDDLVQVLGQWPQLARLSESLLAAYPPLVGGFHRLHFDHGRVTLTLLFGDAEQMLSELDARADAFFFDGFAPSRNPDMWSEVLFRQIARLAAPGATGATYSVAGAVRRGLEDAGFIVEKRIGYARKREMLIASRRGPSNTRPVPEKVVVIGAGIAGTSCAFALARRGIAVVLLDREKSIGAGGSGNPAAVIRPFITLDEGARSRFGWAAFLYAVRLYRQLKQQTGFAWNETGVLQLARNPAHLEKLARAFERFAYPPELASMVDSRQASARAGISVSEQGVWFPGAGFVDGPSLCAALFDNASSLVRFKGEVDAQRIDTDAGLIQIIGTNDRVIESAGAVVLANGAAAKALVPASTSWLRAARGQVTAIRPLVPLQLPVCRDGYVTPEIQGRHYIGATFDESCTDHRVKEKDHAANRQRAARILPQAIDEARIHVDTGWAGVRCVSRDRLPVIGRIDKNLFCCVAMGSRGFSWSPLVGELLASQIANAPVPLERTVLARLSPDRFDSLTHRAKS